MNLRLFKTKLVILGVVLLVPVCPVLAAPPTTQELAKLLPERLGAFRRVGAPKLQHVQENGEIFLVRTQYIAGSGARLIVTLRQLPQDGRAYEVLTTTAQSFRENEPVEISSNVGTAGFVSSREVVFFKGRHCASVQPENARASEKEALALAAELSATLHRGEGEIPILLKHLPDWEQAQKTAIYLNRFTGLDSIAQDAVLSAVVSGGDADAVLAKYGSARLLLIEFNTPQRAAENDRRIVARIQELWKLGQPAPTGYRRIGNYSVFVFDAPNEQTAKQLMDQVKYEQVVSWLGENPNILRAAEQYYVETTLGVLVAVLKASGFALIGCVAAGGLMGALLFMRRRSQQRSVEAFSDAGGMLRLNIDELTPETNPARLIGRQ
ncbi:MAG TPA: hypothetical protein VF074_09705 [Pyrinomonadaceae bacterium]